MIELATRITIDPNVCNGKPTIRGKRITAQTILEFLSSGDSVEDILNQYPTLTEDDIYACLMSTSPKETNDIEPVCN